MSEFYVYQLRVEDEVMPFYVGKGKGGRYKHHLYPSELKANTHKVNKIKKAVSQGKKILHEMLETSLSEVDAFNYEIFFISAYGRVKEGGCLTNATVGGEGVSGHSPSVETRRKLSVAGKGKKMPKDAVERVRLKNLGKKRSHEVKEKMRQAQLGKKRPLDFAAKMSLITRGEGSGCAKLTEPEVIHIYLLFHLGVRGADIARLFELTPATICGIKKGATWKHLHCHMRGEAFLCQ